MRWSDVEIDRATDAVRVTVSATAVEPRPPLVPTLRRGTVKGGRERILIAGADAVAVLDEQFAKSKFTAPGDYVFASANGTMRWPTNIRVAWRRIVAGSDLAWTHPHVLRATFGERVMQQHGLEAARDALGHASAVTTLGHYVNRPTPVVNLSAVELPRLRAV